MQHVVYKETNMLYGGVAIGELSFVLGSNATAGAFYRAGKLQYLAVAAPKRVSAFPNVPTIGESGGQVGFEVSGWTTVAAPRGLPKAVTYKIQRDIENALAEPDDRVKFASFACEPFTLSREQLNAYVQNESSRFGVIVKKAQVTLN